MNSKKQGDIGVGAAIAYFTNAGYTVSLPLTDSQDYDLVVDSGRLDRVQVKTTTRKSRYGVPVCGLIVSGGNRSWNGVRKKSTECESIDSFFIYTLCGDAWWIPREVIVGLSEISLGAKYEKYKLSWGVRIREGGPSGAL